MSKGVKTQFDDSSRLKQVNLELGQLAQQHKACRKNTGIYSAVGAVTLVLSLLGLMHLFPSGASDWTQNPNSPVYEIAVQDQGAFLPKAVIVAAGFLIGLLAVYRARQKCTEQRGLWEREGDLRKEMRRLRDRLYIVDQVHANTEPHHRHGPRQEVPLAPDDVRGEYVGLYNPPSSQRAGGKKSA